MIDGIVFGGIQIVSAGAIGGLFMVLIRNLREDIREMKREVVWKGVCDEKHDNVERIVEEVNVDIGVLNLKMDELKEIVLNGGKEKDSPGPGARR